jgi:hypothetical protein
MDAELKNLQIDRSKRRSGGGAKLLPSYYCWRL